MLNQVIFVGRVTVISDIANCFGVKNEKQVFYFLSNAKIINTMKEQNIVGCVVGVKGHLEIQGDTLVVVADKVSFLQSNQ